VAPEAFVQGISTRKIEKLAQKLCIESISHGQASMMEESADIN
jgi:transposase-like protein